MRSLLLALVLMVIANSASAREFGFHSPGGRQIYTGNETFEEIRDTHRRRAILEAVFGYAPEGNLGLSVGYLLPRPHGLEVYFGYGMALNPSAHITTSLRYVTNIRGYRPYIAAGYAGMWLTDLKTRSDNVFGEIGYSFKVRATYHLTVGAGIRYLLRTHIQGDSPLLKSDVDEDLLQQERDDIRPWSPSFAFRFSRAF